jgi:hypothetical protein
MQRFAEVWPLSCQRIYTADDQARHLTLGFEDDQVFVMPAGGACRVFYQVNGLAERCLDQGKRGALLVCVNAVEQSRIDTAHHIQQERAHA